MGKVLGKPGRIEIFQEAIAHVQGDDPVFVADHHTALAAGEVLRGQVGVELDHAAFVTGTRLTGCLAGNGDALKHR